MSKKILIKCDEATTICDKSQYGKDSNFDKIRLTLHNFLCHRCKLYTEQNKIMTKIFKIHLLKATEEHLSNNDKEDLQKKLEEEMNNLD